MQTTDRMFQLAAGPEWFLAFLRTSVVPSVAKYILGLKDWGRFTTVGLRRQALLERG